MPHHVGARWWSRAARYATAIALLVACERAARDATVVVIVSDGAASGVVASPVDPRPIRERATARSGSDPQGRSIARYYAVADSADSLDAVFQRARDSLNREAKALARDDRRAAEYARRYDSYMRRVAEAVRTREARDRARRRAGAMRTQLREALQAEAMRFHRALDSTARGANRGVHRAQLHDRRATLRLTRGRWWIAVQHDEGLLGTVQRYEARAGARDTVRLRT